VSAFVRINDYKGFIAIDTQAFTGNMKISEGWHNSINKSYE